MWGVKANESAHLPHVEQVSSFPPISSYFYLNIILVFKASVLSGKQLKANSD
jgi:hypothetical protein